MPDISVENGEFHEEV